MTTNPQPFQPVSERPRSLERGIIFYVKGDPAPGGSKKFVGFNKKTKRAIIIDDCKRNTGWRVVVANVASGWWTKPLLTGPLSVSFDFYLSRPIGHYGTGRNAGMLRTKAPKHPAYKPDVLKLARAVEDALTGIIWADDAQIVDETMTKQYADDRPPGVNISIAPI